MGARRLLIGLSRRARGEPGPLRRVEEIAEHGIGGLGADRPRRAARIRGGCSAGRLSSSRVSRRLRRRYSHSAGAAMKYRLTCLTPVLVGDGEKLSAIDY